MRLAFREFKSGYAAQPYLADRQLEPRTPAVHVPRGVPVEVERAASA